VGQSHRRLYAFAPGIALAGILLIYCPNAFALNPARDISQYAHTAWRIRDGFPRGAVGAIAQTPDGYLWLGTELGLVRFDGIKNVLWEPPANQRLPSSAVLSLLVARDGTLWIGTLKGLASWKDGKLTEYPELDGHFIFKIVEDHEGTVWVSGVSVTTGRLCAIRKGSVQCYGDDGALGRGAFNLYEDGKSNLWVGVKDGVWRWRPGPPTFHRLPGETDGIQGLGEDDDGTLLLGWGGGIKRFVDGESETYHLPGSIGKFHAHRLLRDRDGSLWIGTEGEGLVHAHQGRADVFAESDGLSGGFVNSVFEDREGNIWVATSEGLDRFRDFAVATLTVKQGLSNAGVGSVMAAQDGSVWLGTYSGLNRWNNGQIAIFGAGSSKPDGKLDGLHPDSLFQDDRGRIWVSTNRELGYLDGDRFIPVKGLPGGVVNSIAEDTEGSLWIANEHVALFKLLPGNMVQQIPWSRLGHSEPASALAADLPQGGLWIGFAFGGLSYFTGGEVRASYTVADGLGEGRVNGLRFDREGTLWAATNGGLSRLKNGRVATLTSKNGLPCDTVHWVMVDDAGSFWLYTPCGLARIPRADMDAWTAAVGTGSNFKIQPTIFDISDGVRILVSVTHFSPQVAKSSDGKLWFLPWDGVSVSIRTTFHSIAFRHRCTSSRSQPTAKRTMLNPTVMANCHCPR
jgi:ligand-binding sensor domain-containing protein